jgi:hypothetical protein
MRVVEKHVGEEIIDPAVVPTTTTAAGDGSNAAESESSVVPIALWDTKVQLVNPATDIVLAIYPGFTGARFWARKCLESEAGPCSSSISSFFSP